MTGKKVAMVIAPRDFRDEELREPRQHLLDEGAEVDVASATLAAAVGKLGMTVEPDIILDDIDPAGYDGIVFVGGSGSRVYFDDVRVHDLVGHFLAEGKVVGAICIAPAILANAGLLAGRRVTSFETERSGLKSAGALLVDRPVVVDGRIVTAEGPAAAREFGEALAGVLADAEG